MNLTDLQNKLNSTELAKLLKKHHNITLPIDKLNESKSKEMLQTVQKNLQNFRKSSAIHESHTNSNYTALLLLEKTLSTKLKEDSHVLTTMSNIGSTIKNTASKIADKLPKTYANSGTSLKQVANNFKSSIPFSSKSKSKSADNSGSIGDNMTNIANKIGIKEKTLTNAINMAKDENCKNVSSLHATLFAKVVYDLISLNPKNLITLSKACANIKKSAVNSKQFSAIVNKLKKNKFKNVSEEDASLMASAVVGMSNNKMKSKIKLTESVLNESAMSEAEVILAAKDMADRLQDMVENIGKMLNQDLPALVETVRDIMEGTKADEYNSTATQTLTTVLESVRTSKDAMDNAARSLAGEQLAGNDDMGMNSMNNDVSTDPTMTADVPPTDDMGLGDDDEPSKPKKSKSPTGRGKR